MEKEKESGISVSSASWSDTSSSKMEMVLWKPSGKKQLVPLVILTPPFKEYKGKTGLFEAGAKVFNYDIKKSVSINENLYPLIEAIEEVLEGKVEKSIERSVIIGENKIVSFRYSNKFPAGEFSISIISPEGEIKSTTSFNFGYTDELAPYNNSYYENSDFDKVIFYPSKLRMFCEFLKHSIKIAFLGENFFDISNTQSRGSSFGGIALLNRGSRLSSKEESRDNESEPIFNKRRTFGREKTKEDKSSEIVESENLSDTFEE